MYISHCFLPSTVKKIVFCLFYIIRSSFTCCMACYGQTFLGFYVQGFFLILLSLSNLIVSFHLPARDLLLWQSSHINFPRFVAPHSLFLQPISIFSIVINYLFLIMAFTQQLKMVQAIFFSLTVSFGQLINLPQEPPSSLYIVLPRYISPSGSAYDFPEI